MGRADIANPMGEGEETGRRKALITSGWKEGGISSEQNFSPRQQLDMAAVKQAPTELPRNRRRRPEIGSIVCATRFKYFAETAAFLGVMRPSEGRDAVDSFPRSLERRGAGTPPPQMSHS